MSKKIISFSLDVETHADIDHALETQPASERSAYIRTCIAFYEDNKDRIDWPRDSIFRLLGEELALLREIRQLVSK